MTSRFNRSSTSKMLPTESATMEAGTLELATAVGKKLTEACARVNVLERFMDLEHKLTEVSKRREEINLYCKGLQLSEELREGKCSYCESGLHRARQERSYSNQYN